MLPIDQKYMRVQVRYSGKTGKPVGIFGACWHLMRGTMRQDCLTDEDKETFLSVEAWFEEHLPNPPFYEDGNTIRGITWFKTGTTDEMVARLDPLLRLLEKYGVPYDVVFTNHPGEIVYEDEFQVGVV